MRKPGAAQDREVAFAGRPGDGEWRHVTTLGPDRQGFPVGAPQVQLFAYRKRPLSPVPNHPPSSLLLTLLQANILFQLDHWKNRVLLFLSQLSFLLTPVLFLG